MAWTVDWAVRVDGRDMSPAMRGYLITIEITDQAGSASDACRLTFDDSEGRLLLPPEGARVEVLLQDAPTFNGIVDSVRSTGTRGGGRLLAVGAKGFDTRGPATEPLMIHADDLTLEDFLGKVARIAGFSLRVDPSLAAIARDYWAADGESFVHLGQRLGRELNATFKLRGDQAVLARRGADAGLATVEGVVGAGGNVVSWEIAPVTGRRAFTRARVRFFDRETARFEEEEVEIGLDRDLPEAVNLIRTPAADRDQARAIAEARKGEAAREGGEGRVTLDLAVTAQAEAPFRLVGARDGVDGLYRIVSVTHRADRGSGATTALALKQPQDSAGKDQRRPPAEPAVPGTDAAGGGSEAPDTAAASGDGAAPGGGGRAYPGDRIAGDGPE